MSQLELALYVLAYLLGSIPFGLVFTFLFGLGDVRKVGSGNIGTINAFRAGSKLVGILTLLGDIAKGFFAVYIMQSYVHKPEAAAIAGALAVVGHIYPVYLRFKGGKGVAAYLGVLFAWSWPVAIGFVTIWVVVAYWGRVASVASLTGSTLSIYGLWFFNKQNYLLLAVALVILIFYAHRENLKRLHKGQELTIGRTKSKKSK